MSHVNIIRRVDGIDAGEFRDMVESNAFGLYRAKIIEILESERKRLETVSPDELTKLQGGIAMLRVVLAAPDRMLEVMRKEVRKV